MKPIMRIVLSTLAAASGLLAVRCDASGVLKDTVPGSGNGYNSLNQFWVPFDGDVIFWGNNGIWRTDGTSAGTVLIQAPVGSLSTPDDNINSAVATESDVFFLADDGLYGIELWRTDGTNGGALRLTDLKPGSANSGIDVFNASNNQFFFTAFGQEYTTDGTNAASVHTFGGTDNGGNVLFNLGKYYFLCGTGVCVSDGTNPPTTLISLITAHQDFVAVNEKVFFTAKTSALGNELYVTDGTVGGTKMVADIATGTPDSNPTNLTRMDDKLYFIARDLTHGYELWTSDGTTASMVVDLNPTGDGANSLYGIYGASDGILYFAGNDGSTGAEIFKTDGTAANTVIVKDNAPGSAFGTGFGTFINGSVFFLTSLGAQGGVTQIAWVSDGTAQGTRALDPTTGVVSNNLVAANGKLIFPGFQAGGSVGVEPMEMNLERITGHKWCSRPERTIPDTGTVSDTIKLPEWGSIQSVVVDLDIAHTYVHDLRARLVAPDNTSVDLINQPMTTGGASCSGDLIAIHLADANSLPVQTKCSNATYAYPLHTNFKPAQPLAAFANKSTKGKWSLVVDDLAAHDIGTLHEWCVNFSTDRIFFHDFED